MYIDSSYFVNDDFLLNKPFLKGMKERLRYFENENQDRKKRITPLLTNKKVLDFGCGDGALMDKVSGICESIEGLELTANFRKRLQEKGYTVHSDILDCDDDYDVILMFHVLEHLPDPV